MESGERSKWRKLDNAALLFSASSNATDPRVFRFYCELNEEIKHEALQLALGRTTEVYPIFLSVMRKGLFWHYLEESNLRPLVRVEYKDPCSMLYVRDKKSLLFEVTYYKNRINFEVFHALTDGSGATEFLRELVKQYLLIRYEADKLPDIALIDKNITVQDQENDGFTKYYSKESEVEKKKKPRAFQIRKTGRGQGKLQVSEHVLSVKNLLEKARGYNVSITVLLVATLLCAIQKEMTKLQEKRPIILMVPVNLRKLFPSDSMLNFFGWIEPGFLFENESFTFEEVLYRVDKQFKEDLTKEKMGIHINSLTGLEKHPILKFFPLEIKNIGISSGAKYSEKNVTAVLSNMSAVVMPEEYQKYIYRFGVYTSTPKVELCVCSYGDILSFGFTSRFNSVNIQRNFYQILENEGVESKEVEPSYPQSDTPKLGGIKIFRLFTFLCIVAAVIVAATNVIFTPDSLWSLIAIGGIVSSFCTISIGYYKRNNLMKNAMWQLILITCGCVVWDALMGWNGWSIDYVFPAVGVATLVTMLVMAKIQEHSAKEYMIYLVMASMYSFMIPFILLLTGAIQVVYPSVISVGIGFLMIIGLMIFRWKAFKEEIAKKFHV